MVVITADRETDSAFFLYFFIKGVVSMETFTVSVAYMDFQNHVQVILKG